MTAKILQLPPGDQRDMPRMLRWYAQQIEDGHLALESGALVLNHGGRFLPDVIMLGQPLGHFALVGLLDTAAKRAAGVAFHV